MIKKILLSILGFLALCVIGILVFAKDFEVKITEETAQEAVNAQLGGPPLNRLGVEIDVQSATLDFRSDNTMKFDTEFTTEALGYNNRVKGTFQSGIRYKSPRIYLDKISPSKIEVTTDEETREELNEIKSAARKFLDRQKERINGEDGKDVLDKIIGENDGDFQDTLVRASYPFFEFVPIYDLNDAGYKGSLASLALKDVTFHDDYVAVTLSPKKAMLRILAILGTMLLILGYFLGKSLLSTWVFDRLFGKPSDKV